MDVESEPDVSLNAQQSLSQAFKDFSKNETVRN